jgi:hypothetical protein
MTFCSLSEAWGQGPDGIDTGKYQSVNYQDSNIYNYSGDPVFENHKTKIPPKRIPNMSRTQNRLPQHNGPANRYTKDETSVSINYDDNNNISIDNIEKPFNKKNNELPITKYSKSIYSKNRKNIKSPVHQIIYKQPNNNLDNMEEDLNDTIDNIINTKDKNYKINHKGKNNKKNINNNTDKSSINSDSQDSTDTISIASSTSISIDNPVSVTSKYNELSKKYKNKNDIIKYLILANDKLTKLVKKKELLDKPKGIFSQMDLIIVVCLGILMIIVLQYVYKIAIAKN